MKTLKKFFCVVMLAAVNSMLVVATFAQTPVSGGANDESSGGGGSGSSSSESSLSSVGTVDSEEVALLIAQKGITEFRGKFTFERITLGSIPGCTGTSGYSPITGQSCAGNTGSSAKHIEGSFRLWYGRIIDLVIDGVKIPDDNDRYTLPVNRVGTVRHFNLTVEGINDRERVLYGEFSTYELSPGETIQILLRPNAVPLFFGYTPAPEIDAASLRLSVQNGVDSYDTYYDVSHAGFNVWLTPGVATSYRIYNEEDNRTIETGTIDTTRLTVTPSEEPSLFSSVMGNVEYSLNGWFSKRGLQMDSTIVSDDGSTTLGKVVAYNNSEGKRLQITAQGLYPGSKILVKRADQNLTVIETFIVSEDYRTHDYVTFVTSQVVESAVVTVIGKTLDEGFTLSLNARYNDVTPGTPAIEEK